MSVQPATSSTSTTRQVIVRFEDPSLADWHASRASAPTRAQAAAWMQRAAKRQQARLAELASAGVQFRVEHRYLRVLNGVSIVVHGDAAHMLARVDGVAQVVPVRTLVPALVRDADGAAGAAAVVGAARAPGGSSTARTRVAVLDAAVDAEHPSLRGASIAQAFDATRGEVETSAGPLAAHVLRPDEHGTSIAGAVLAGAGARRAGVELLPIQTLANRPAAAGGDELLGESDDLLAGLEHSVDPDGNGELSDRARVALVASTTPSAGFSRSLEARAAAAAAQLGTLVVAATGNDGPRSGSVGSLAASPDVLAVGAVDARSSVRVADVALRGSGIDEVLRSSTLLSSARAVMPAGAAPIVDVGSAGGDVVDFLDAQLRSRVEGRVALVTMRADVLIARQVRAAADAGAVAVLVDAANVQSAANILDENGTDIAAIAIDPADAAALRSALADGAQVSASISARDAANPQFGTVPGFSSTGPRLDGHRGVDVVAPGVGLIAAGAGGGWRVATGTSIAAAWAAGQAAHVMSARADWTPREVRAALIATAHVLGSPQDRPPVTRQGAGMLDAARAIDASWASSSGIVDFGAVAPGGRASAKLDIAALSGSAAAALGAPELDVRVDADEAATIAPGLDGDTLMLTAPADTRPGSVGGWLVLPNHRIRVPWVATVTAERSSPPHITASLAARTLVPTAGPASRAGTLHIELGEPAERVEVSISTKDGASIGVVGSIDAALPGVHELALADRAPNGTRLAPGVYRINVRVRVASDPDGTWHAGPELRVVVPKR